MDFLKDAAEAIQDAIGLAPHATFQIIWTVFIVLAYLTINMIVTHLIRRHVEDTSRQYSTRKTASYLLGILAFLIVFWIWFGVGGGLVTYLGILSAGLAIALQDPLTNFAGWIFLVVRRPFVVGDRIEIADKAGDVIDIRLFQFSLIEIGNWVDADQSTGRIIHVPNGLVFKSPVANFTQGFNFIWNEIAVMVTFESQWKKAKEILQRIADEKNFFDSREAEKQVRQVSGKYMIYYKHLTPMVWTRVDDCGVTLTIRYLCDPRRRRTSEMDIWEDILEAFSREPDIDFAYPTQRIYFNPREGKSETGGPGLEEEDGSEEKSPDQIPSGNRT